MRLAVSIVSILLLVSPSNFGTEAVHPDQRFEKGPKSFLISLFDSFDVRDLDIVVEPVPSSEIAKQLADLRDPEGPPSSPPDAPIEAVCDTLAAAAQANGLPTGFFARLIWQESRFKQRAVSSAGAQGVAQFMPAVAVERGLRNPFDPIAALPESAEFLRDHVRYFGNVGLAAAAYNAGARRVTDWLARRGRLPDETRNYVKIITGHEPEKWIETTEIALAVELPSRAPCDGVGDLSRTAAATKVAVQLEPPVAKIVEDARIAAARAAEEARARIAAAAAAAAALKSKRAKLLAKGKGGKDKAQDKVAVKPADKSAKLPPKIADRVGDKPASKRGVRVADTSAARR